MTRRNASPPDAEDIQWPGSDKFHENRRGLGFRLAPLGAYSNLDSRCFPQMEFHQCPRARHMPPLTADNNFFTIRGCTFDELDDGQNLAFRIERLCDQWTY